MTNRLRDTQRGQALVEFALIVPVFILLVMGIFDLGRAVYGYNTVNNAAREGARLAIVDQTITEIKTEAVNHAVGLGLGVNDVTVDFRSSSTPGTANSCATLQINCIANVRVNYLYQAATPIIGNLVGQISIYGESQFTIESVCVEPTQPSCPLGN
jgi:Flp pilus assembly protein TadG